MNAEDLPAPPGAGAADGLFRPRCRCCPLSPESDCTLMLLAMERPEEMVESEPVNLPFSDRLEAIV